MKNKVTVTVAGRTYTLTSTEDPAYITQVAERVNNEMLALQNATRASILDTAIMTAINLADDYQHAISSNEDLRRQLKEALDEKNRIDSQLSEAKREIVRLQLGKR